MPPVARPRPKALELAPCSRCGAHAPHATYDCPPDAWDDRIAPFRRDLDPKELRPVCRECALAELDRGRRLQAIEEKLTDRDVIAKLRAAAPSLVRDELALSRLEAKVGIVS